MSMSRTHTVIAVVVMTMVAAATVVTFVRDDSAPASALAVRSQPSPSAVTSDEPAVPEPADSTPTPETTPTAKVGSTKSAPRISETTRPRTTPTTNRPSSQAPQPEPEPSRSPTPSPEPTKGLIGQLLDALLGG